jgi:multisubunit Na+/H+ antiporter MnhF subunit
MWGVGTVIFGKSPRSLVAFRVALLLFGVALIAVGVQFLRGGQVADGVVSLLGGSGVLVTVMSLL